MYPVDARPLRPAPSARAAYQPPAYLRRPAARGDGWRTCSAPRGVRRASQVNSVGLAALAGVEPLAIPLAFGAAVGAGGVILHERHHRRVCDAYTPEGVDRAAIFVPPSPQADTA